VLQCTNNIAEYKAILLGLRKLRAIGVQKYILHTDSKVVTRHIEKECFAREPALEKYLGLIRKMENYFKGFTVEYIEQNKNCEADELAKVTAHNIPMPTDVFFKWSKTHHSKQSHRTLGSSTLLKGKIGELQ
jgi:ribonuclease HI